MRGRGGDVVGIWYVGYPISTLKDLGHTVEQARVLEGGFLARPDKNGKVLFKSSHVAPELVTKVNLTGEADRTGRWLRVERAFDPWGYSILAAYRQSDFVQGRITQVRLAVAVAGLLVVFFIGGVIAFNVSRIIITPVNALERAAARLATGDIEVDVDSRSQNEMGGWRRPFGR